MLLQLQSPTINFTGVLQFLIYGPGLFFGIVFASQAYILEEELESNNAGADSYFSFMTEKFKLIWTPAQLLAFYKGMCE